MLGCVVDADKGPVAQLPAAAASAQLTTVCCSSAARFTAAAPSALPALQQAVPCVIALPCLLYTVALIQVRSQQSLQ